MRISDWSSDVCSSDLVFGGGLIRSIGGASGGERGAAAAGGLGVRVADHELRAAEVLGVVDLRAAEVLQRQRIAQQGDAIALDRQVVLGLGLVEGEAVLEAGTATAGDVHPQLQDRKSTRLNSSH